MQAHAWLDAGFHAELVMNAEAAVFRSTEIEIDASNMFSSRSANRRESGSNISRSSSEEGIIS